MANRNNINGDNGSNSLKGTEAAEVIYGFSPHAQGASIKATHIAHIDDFGFPTAIMASPDDPDHLFVTERGGVIKVVDLTTGQVQSSPFLDLSSEVDASDEQGLLGVAFDPDYATNGYFYVYVSVKNAKGDLGSDVEIRRYTRSADNALVTDPNSKHLIRTIDFPAETGEHRGGWIGFGPDGYLYAAVGDGGRNPQTLDRPLGKILRLDVHGDDFPNDVNRNYAVPMDNPTQIDGIAGDATGTGIYAVGLRNPWKASFDRATGAFYIADVGTSRYEEINLGRAGANYGWSRTEGPFDPGTYPHYTNPIHAFANGSYVVGGYVYRGQEDAFHGQYFFADTGLGVWAMDTGGNTWSVSDVTAEIRDDMPRYRNPGVFGEDALGNLYTTSFFTGDLIKLSPQSASTDEADVLDGAGGDDVIFAGAGDDKVLGGSGKDELNGMAGNDAIDGGTGRDRMLGGRGNDSYIIDDANDVVLEKADEGKDTIRTKVSYTLRDTMSVEVLWTTNTSGTAAINLTGNKLDNQISGNAGGNVLSGLGGKDLIRGLLGDDTISGGSGNDDLHGDAGNDEVDGGAEADKLQGGAGADRLTGGKGADTFVWVSVADTGLSAAEADIVLDFDRSEGDLIRLLSIDAREDRDGAQAFSFVGTSAFTRAGQVRYEVNEEQTLIYLNTDADNDADGIIRLAGVHDVKADWFVL